MIVELRQGLMLDGKTKWLCTLVPYLAGYFPQYYAISNALDWLWQKINRNTDTWVVIKDGDTLRLVQAMEDVSNSNGTILFSGNSREIVMQLRPYMQLMEGS